MTIHDECALRAAAGMPGMLCDGDRCTYWRVAGALGVEAEEAGCAIQYFKLLDGGADMATWLLSVKERCESGNLSA